MTGFFMEKKIQLTEKEIKEQKKLRPRALYSEKLIKIINNTEIKFYREVDIPKTKTGITNKAKKLLEEYKTKMKKDKKK